jgi:hypothetical protein
MSNSAGMLGGGDLDVGTDELRQELERAGRLTHTLSALASRVKPREPLFVRLFGRDQEIRTVVGATLSDWSDGAIDARVAAHRIRTYVHELEHAVRSLHLPLPEPPPGRRFGRARADVESTWSEE